MSNNSENDRVPSLTRAAQNFVNVLEEAVAMITSPSINNQLP